MSDTVAVVVAADAAGEVMSRILTRSHDPVKHLDQPVILVATSSR
jgi:hypothetical protein